MRFDIGSCNLGPGLDNPRQARPIFRMGLDNPCPGIAHPINGPYPSMGGVYAGHHLVNSGKPIIKDSFIRLCLVFRVN